MRALMAVFLLAAACGTKVVDLDPPDATADPNAPPGTPPAADPCFAQTMDDNRCVYCRSSPLVAKGCLKCEAFEANAPCRLCYWSDDPKNACKQCQDPSGKVAPDACDGVRSDLPRPSP